MIINYEIDTIYLTYKDRLLRMGYELILSICEEFNTKIVIINQVEESFNETLVKDLLEITTVFSSGILPPLTVPIIDGTNAFNPFSLTRTKSIGS